MKQILIIVLVTFTASTFGQRKNLDNFKLLIRDTSVLSLVSKGVFPHPALEIGMKKPYTFVRSNGFPIRIAIDPGHIASNRKEAIMEERYIKSKYGFFYESNLNMATALVLKSLLEARGFEVMLTRQPGETALGMSYTRWFKKRFREDLLNDLNSKVITKEQFEDLLRSNQKDIFNKYFKNKDFVARSNKINSFQADLTLVIHYNASEFESNPMANSPVVDYNYSVAFVPGGFTTGELSIENQLEDFIKLASSDLLPKSILLSSYIVQEFEKKLGAPLLKQELNQELWYLKKYSIYTEEPGVYARNLYMTRALNSPVCYGECLLQNNFNEIKILALKTFVVGAIKTSPRVKDVAECYYTGVLKYLQSMNWIRQ